MSKKPYIADFLDTDAGVFGKFNSLKQRAYFKTKETQGLTIYRLHEREEMEIFLSMYSQHKITVSNSTYY